MQLLMMHRLNSLYWIHISLMFPEEMRKKKLRFIYICCKSLYRISKPFLFSIFNEQLKEYPRNPLFDKLTLISGRTLHFKAKKDTTSNKITVTEVSEEGKEKTLEEVTSFFLYSHL